MDDPTAIVDSSTIAGRRFEDDREMRVLHVDDDPDLVDLAATFLERQADDIEVVTSTAVADALSRLDEERFDCVISDYDMPDENGLEFLETVREDSPDLPFVLFTGKGSEEIASRAISAGVSEYLQKEGGTDQYAILANRIENLVLRYRAELQVRRGFRAMESAREGISILDEEGRFVYVNDAYVGVVGYDREELLGEHWELLYPDGEVDRMYEEVLPDVPERGRWTGRTLYVRKDGLPVTVDHALGYTGEGAMICLIREATGGDGPSIADDAFVDAVLEAIDDVCYVLGPDGRIVRANDRAVEVTGYGEDELTAGAPLEAVVPEDRDAVVSAIREALRTGAAQVEARILTKDGRTIPCEFEKHRLADDGGNVFGVVGIGHAIADADR